MEKLQDRFADIGEFVPQDDDDVIVCRCEEITKGEIRKAVHEGIFTISEMRRYLRNGMGLCQGQTCGKMVKGIMARELGIRPIDLTQATARAPMRPMVMKILANDRNDD